MTTDRTATFGRDGAVVSRRTFAAGTAALGIAGSAGAQGEQRMQDLTSLTAAIRAGSLTAQGHVRKMLRRVSALSGLNAFVTLDEEGALARAVAIDEAVEAGAPIGPLAGALIAVKDNIAVRGLPMTACPPALRGYRPGAHATVWARLEAAGATCLGKAGMHELAFGGTSASPAFGVIRNPWSPDVAMTPGGSSGGSGAAVAAGLGDAGLGTDTAGSIRMPASLCGLVGFRPSVGRLPMDGIAPLSHTRDTVGPMTHSVADAALLDAIMAGETPTPLPRRPLRGLRLLAPEDPCWQGLDPATEAACRSALSRLSRAGVTVVRRSIPGLFTLANAAGANILLSEMIGDMRAFLDRSEAGVTLESLISQIALPDVRLVWSQARDAEGLLALLAAGARDQHRPALQAILSDALRAERAEAMVFPTTIRPARPVRETGELEVEPGVWAPAGLAYTRNMEAGTAAGWCGISLPVGITPDGLPVGLSIEAPPGRDRALLVLAAEAERILGFDARPPIG
jgi:Asp-tRNA(Asn)/Glu-tRNA(Gln) amidotransferase A subunit family amidase